MSKILFVLNFSFILFKKNNIKITFIENYISLSVSVFDLNFKNMQYAAKDMLDNILIHFYTSAEPNFIFFSMGYGPASGIR